MILPENSEKRTAVTHKVKELRRKARNIQLLMAGVRSMTLIDD